MLRASNGDRAHTHEQDHQDGSRANVWPNMPLPPIPLPERHRDPLVGYAARRRGLATGGIISLSIVVPPRQHPNLATINARC
jgi:hypothetical protein